MTKSETIAKLAEALAKAQAEMKAAIKDSDNPFFKSKYSDLSSVWDACRQPLTKNGLSVSQMPETRDNQIVVHTLLMHSSGEWIASELAMTPTKGDPQGAGSAITYARRYALSAAVGIAPDDDDGNAASAKEVTRTTKEIPAKKPFKADAPEPEMFYTDKHAIQGEGLSRFDTKEVMESIKAAVAREPGSDDGDEFIPLAQQRELAIEFRKALPETRKKESENLRTTWLAMNFYTDQDGNPSSTAIPSKDYPDALRSAIGFAKGVGK